MLTLTRASTHQLYAVLRRACGASRPKPPLSVTSPPTDADGDRDLGAVSLEQVLWFVAVAVSVGVIAAILWNRIFAAADEAELDVPVAPGG